MALDVFAYPVEFQLTYCHVWFSHPVTFQYSNTGEMRLMLQMLQLPRKFLQPLPKVISDVGMLQAKEHAGLDKIELVPDVVRM